MQQNFVCKPWTSAVVEERSNGQLVASIDNGFIWGVFGWGGPRLECNYSYVYRSPGGGGGGGTSIIEGGRDVPLDRV